VLALACALPAPGQTSPPETPSEASAPLRFWAGVDAGYASLHRSYSVTNPTSDGTFTFALRGGIQITPRILIGAEVGGWTLQATSTEDPSKGEGIGTRFVIAQAFPLADSPLFVRGGGGRAVYWNYHPGENGASGPAAIVGAGYDFRLGQSSFYFTPSVDYSWGRIDGAVAPPGVTQDQRYRALSLRAGITYR